MQINIEKKHFYGILGLIILITSGMIIYANVDTSGAWHPLQSISKSNNDLTSVDEDGNGIIDKSDTADVADVANSVDWDDIDNVPSDLGSSSSSDSSSPESCSLPWGGSISDGDSVTAYEKERVDIHSSCDGQTRTCNNGDLSGGYIYENCVKDERSYNVGYDNINFYTGYTGCVDVDIDCREYIGSDYCKINWNKIGINSGGRFGREDFTDKGSSTIKKGQTIDSGIYSSFGSDYSCIVKWDNSDNKIKVVGKSSSEYEGDVYYQEGDCSNDNLKWYVL